MGRQDSTKTVLITGGAGGIGLCAAREFARKGYAVVLTDIDQDKLEAAGASLPGECKVATYVVDVRDREQVEALAAKVLERFGALDVLVNNAGVGYHGELASTPLETWKLLVDVNFWGPLHHIYAFLPSMVERGGGAIVNVSSGQAFIRMPTWGAYACIKSALGAFSEILHFEVRKKGVHVSTVYPFMVNTGFYEDVEGESWGHRLSMRLLPYYSLKPEELGRQIYRAATKRTRIELTSVINKMAYYTRVIPGVPELVSMSSYYLMSESDKERKAA